MLCVCAQPLLRWHLMLQARSQGGVYGSCAAHNPPPATACSATAAPFSLARPQRESGPSPLGRVPRRGPERVEQGDVPARPHLPFAVHQPQSSDARQATLPRLCAAFAPRRISGVWSIGSCALPTKACPSHSVQRGKSAEKEHRIATSLAGKQTNIERSTISASKQATRSTAYYSEASASQSHTTSPICSARLR